MSGDTNLNELGEFLRARRAEISPAAGLPDSGNRRRVAGLPGDAAAAGAGR